jgi:hypothetical protein
MNLYKPGYFKALFDAVDHFIMGKMAKLGKKSSIYLYGPADTGKSGIYELIMGFIPPHRQATVISDTRWCFEDIYQKTHDNALVIHNSEWRFAADLPVAPLLKMMEMGTADLMLKGIGGSHSFKSQGLKVFCSNAAESPHWKGDLKYNQDAFDKRLIRILMETDENEEPREAESVRSAEARPAAATQPVRVRCVRCCRECEGEVCTSCANVLS